MKTFQIPKKTASEKIKNSIFDFVVVMVVYWILVSLVQVLLEPFRILFMSDRQRFASKMAKAKEKIEKRVYNRKIYDEDPNNMLSLYLERFKIHPDKYVGDCNNDNILNWFNGLKNGILLDTDLTWAPEVYEGDLISENFLNYLLNQVELHRNSSLRDQVSFMKTLRNFYPEFTPKYSVLLSEIKGFQEKAKAQALTQELTDVVIGSGVPDELAQELVKAYLTPKELKEAITVVRGCTVKGYGIEMGRFCLAHKYDVNTAEQETSDMVNQILTFSNNEDIALALIRGSLSFEELNEMLKNVLDQEFGSKKSSVKFFNNQFYGIMKNKTLRELSV